MNKIALVINDLVRFGGAERYLLEQFKYLNNKGYNCRIFTWEFDPELLSFKQFSEKVCVIDSNSPRLQARVRKITQAIGDWRPDLVIAHTQPANIVGYNCFKKFKVPYCLNIHGTFINFPHDLLRYSGRFCNKFSEYLNRNPGLEEFIVKDFGLIKLTLKKRIQIRYWARLDYLSFQNAELIFTLSEKVKENIKYLYECESIVHHPGTGIMADAVKPEIKFNPDDLNLLFIGRLDKRKRVGLILESVKTLKSQVDKNVKCFIIGDGPELESLKKHSEQLELGSTMAWPGKVSDNELNWFLKNCDMLLYPSWVTYGLIVLEALISGLPVIISRDTGLAPALKAEPGVAVIVPEVKELVKSVKQFMDFEKSGINTTSIKERFSNLKAFTNLEHELKNHLLLKKPGEINVVMIPKFSNPYQEILIRELRRNKCNVLTDFNCFARSNLKRIHDRIDLIHLHWLDPFYLNVKNKFQAIRNSSLFLHKIRYLKKHGVKVIKTIHNRVNHKRIFPELDIRIRKKLQNILDGGIVKSTWAGSILEQESGPVFSNLKVIYLPNYSGVYPDFISKSEARKELGLREGDKVVLFFGWIQPYKRVEKLLDLKMFKEETKFKFLLAGQAVPPDYREGLLKKLKPLRGVMPYLKYIPDDKIQVYFNASDVFILPYSNFLTSSNLMLALTFGLPIIASDHGYFREIMNGSSNRIVDMEDSLKLENEIISFFEEDLEKICEENKRLSEKFSPEKIGRETVEYYREIINEK